MKNKKVCSICKHEQIYHNSRTGRQLDFASVLIAEGSGVVQDKANTICYARYIYSCTWNDILCVGIVSSSEDQGIFGRTELTKKMKITLIVQKVEDGPVIGRLESLSFSSFEEDLYKIERVCMAIEEEESSMCCGTIREETGSCSKCGGHN